MWSNFTDFALKAQKDLQDQANEAASKLQQQLPPISAPPVVGVTVPTMSSFFNLDAMQPSSSTTTTTTFAQDPLPQSNVGNDMIHNINHDMMPPTEIVSEQNVAIAEPTESVEDVPTPMDMVTESDSMIPTNDDDVINCIENDTKMDDHGNRIPSNVESSIIEDVTIIPNQDTTTDDNDDDDDQTNNTNVALTMEQTEILMTTAPTSSFLTTNVEESAPTTDTIVPSDLEETTTAPEPVVSFPGDDEQIHMDDHNHNHVPATTGTMMVVEADEDTSHSMSIQENNNNILSPIKELILPTTTKVGNNLNVTNNNETTTSHVESSMDQQQQQHEKINDDQSDATTTTTAPQQETYIRQSKHQDIPAVETIPEVIVSEVVDVGQAGIPSSSTTNNNIHMLSPMTPSPNISKHRPTKKLLLLISTNSIDRQVKVRQDLVLTALTAANIEYDVIDGSIHNDNNTTNITLRNELFALSGLRGIYPQFFIVNLLESHNIDRGDGTGTKFWGTFEEFQHVNDDGQLQQVFGSYSTTTGSDSILESPDNKTITRNLYPSDTLPQAARPLHDKEGISVGEKSTTMTVPDDVFEKFSQQIQRIEENYQLERQETEQRHLQEIQNQQQLYEQCEQEKRELEEKLSNEIKQKDEQLQEMYRRNEGYRLKLDVLKREVTGTLELVQGRDQELQKASQKYLNDLRAMEKQFNNAEKSAIKFQEEVQIMQTKLDKSEAELLSSKQEYEAMKDRAKDVATELKHRRAECRQLQDSVAELTEQNNHLKSTVGSLEERLNHQGLNQSDKDKEIESLRAKVTEAQQELKNVETVWQEKLSKSESVLTEYKKRAQHSLSMSNSRTAAAVQAREEAELDARAARSTADAALERSVKAEVECREAIAKAKIAVKAMEDERDEALRNLDQLKLQIVAAESMRVEKERDMESVMATLKNKNVEIEHLQKVMNEADAKIASMQHKIMESTNTIDDLREEIMALREELQRATISTANIVSVQNNEDNSSGVKHAPSSLLQNGLQVDAEGDDTIATLRMELREANDAIEDLKSALKNAIELNEQQQRVASVSSSNLTGPDDSGRSDIGQTNSSDSGTIPLFYAMEKQAELKTARTEMNRLASLLADIQSEKTEAYDAMEEMRRKLDEAESRLKRNEKLGMIQSTTNSTIEAGNENSNASAVNIEYLKHILLRYMNAKTQTERKMLVPVIGAVLELTPDEVHAATQNIERNSASIVASNGSSLFSFLS